MMIMIIIIIIIIAPIHWSSNKASVARITKVVIFVDFYKMEFK